MIPSFREWLVEEAILEYLENYRVLNEMTRVFDGDVTAEFVDRELIKPIQKAAINKEILDTGINVDSARLIYIPINKTDYIFTLANKTSIVGATKLERLGIIGDDLYYMMKITKKLQDEVGNMLFKLYREISLFLNIYVVTDNIQSVSSSSIWKKMFNNRSKYNIKDLKILDNSNKVIDYLDISDIWGKSKEFEDKLVAIKFK